MSTIDITDEDFEQLAREAAAAGDRLTWAMALGAAGRQPQSHGGTLPDEANEILLKHEWDVLQDRRALRDVVEGIIRGARASA